MKTFKELISEAAKIIATYKEKDIEVSIVKNKKGAFDLIVDKEVIDTFNNEAQAKKEAEQFIKVAGK